MMKIQKIAQSLMVALSMILAVGACKQEQVSGIQAISHIETVACQGQEKTLEIRNENISEPQRVQGVHFEYGTNEQKYFEVVEIQANGQVKKAVSNLVQEILLPPGGMMEVKVKYNPKEVTSEGEYHATYLDVVLNGPKMGIMQVEIRGTAPTALEGCTPDLGISGDTRTFEVIAVQTILSNSVNGDSAIESDLDISTDVSGDFILAMNGDEATLTSEGWPTITFPLPDGTQPEALDITVTGESDPANFSGNSLELKNVSFSAGGVINLSGLDLTTGSITIDSSEAPSVAGGTITLQGSELNDQGEIILVSAAALVGIPVLESQPGVNNGVFGLKLTLKEK